MCTTLHPLIHRLERRRSSSKKLSRLDPTLSILHAHDAYEYKKSRRQRDDLYRYSHRQSASSAPVRPDEFDRVFYPDGSAFSYPHSHSKTMSSTTGTTMTGASTAVAGMDDWPLRSPLGWGNVLEATTTLRRDRKSEMSLTTDRARALEWMSSTSVFSPGVLQDWMGGEDEVWGDKGRSNERYGPDPWALRPLEEMD